MSGGHELIQGIVPVQCQPVVRAKTGFSDLPHVVLAEIFSYISLGESRLGSVTISQCAASFPELTRSGLRLRSLCSCVLCGMPGHYIVRH